jgi:hypothetical protein
MKSSQEHYNIGVALAQALEPLVDVCLATGVTSPEFESLLRVVFVLRAFEKLPRHKNSGKPPTANKVALATGINWEDVAKIKAAGGPSAAKEMMQARERTSSKAARVVHGWTTDPRFLTSGGLPLDLPIKRNREKRSFKDLVSKYAPSTHAGTLLKEMTRREQVQVIDGEIVRYRRATTRLGGLSPQAIAEASKRVKKLGQTLFENLSDSATPTFYDESETINLSAEQIALVRPILERRARTFLKAIETEFAGRGRAVKDEEAELGVSVFSWKNKL